MSDGNDHWFRALEDQMREQSIGHGYAVVARLYEFGVLVRLMPLDAIVPEIVTPMGPLRETLLRQIDPFPDPNIRTARWTFTGRTEDGHMHLESWVKAIGTPPPHICAQGMVDVAFADYELTGGTF